MSGALRSTTALAAAIALGMLAAAAAAAAAGPAPVQARGGRVHDEPLRPQFHFTPARNWMNDPNGLVHVDGEYHLFYQYNPQGETWGHMSWGHAVSRDLVHWRELPVAIPEDPQYMIFSGSIVVDEGNTSGFGAPGSTPLVAIFTGAEPRTGGRQNQQLAFSTDRGRTWTKYAGNPVLDLGIGNFRDPKVFWYGPGKRWVMAAVLAARHQVALFGSPDLKHWTHLSDFGPAGAADGAWECPDLFPLPVNGDPATVRWVLKVDVFESSVVPGSGAQFFVGRFDGTTFAAEPSAGEAAAGSAATAVNPIDYGRDFYAAASWAHLPDAQRHVWIAWMSNHEYARLTPTSPWRGAMTLPRDVSLRSEDGGWRLVQSPVRELASLRGRRVRIPAGRLDGAVRRLALRRGAGNTVELQAQFSAAEAGDFGIRVHVGAGQSTQIGYDRARGELYVDRSRSGSLPTAEFAARSAAPLVLHGGRLKLDIWVDRSSVEVFADDGERVLTEQVFPAPGSDGIELFARDGSVRIESLDVWEIDENARRAADAR